MQISLLKQWADQVAAHWRATAAERRADCDALEAAGVDLAHDISPAHVRALYTDGAALADRLDADWREAFGDEVTGYIDMTTPAYELAIDRADSDHGRYVERLRRIEARHFLAARIIATRACYPRTWDGTADWWTKPGRTLHEARDFGLPD